jgi:uncharacterized protein (DUF2147 family)
MEIHVMTRLLPKMLLLMLSAMVALPGNAENELAGYWQHESEPIWIEMQPDEGRGVMLRNDNKPDRVGFLVVTDLSASSEPGEWSAQVYAAQLGEYRKAEIKLLDDDLMSFTVKVGFMRRTVEWSRVPEVPPAPNDE